MSWKMIKRWLNERRHTEERVKYDLIYPEKNVVLEMVCSRSLV